MNLVRWPMVGVFYIYWFMGSLCFAQPDTISESDRANTFFDRVFDERVARYPERQTYLGIKDNYGDWNDSSDAMARQELEITKENLAWLNETIDYEKLDVQTKISYLMWVQRAEDQIRNFKYRNYNYPVNQMFGRHTGVPSFLINMHLAGDDSDAGNYVERLKGIGEVFDQLIDNLKMREKLGVLPPKFVFPRAIESSRNVITGAPFDDSAEDSALWEDFRSKLQKLDLGEPRKVQLQTEARDALVDLVKPAYERLIAFLQEQGSRATTDDGVWKFEDGDAFYNEALHLTTTTKLTAEEIHQIGLNEVKRIHNEMRSIMKTVEFEGDLQDFFEFMRTDEQFYYPNTEEGKEAYIKRAVEVIDDMKERLDTLFITKPEADLIVKRVEAFREKSAGT
ncbi:MAG TPA: DUF885 domain-containing protein, partial [Opitutae bacterium]|nr:DUF885 domain-containing protein [Opitutae bacterium]